ncbi:MAG: ParB/RepB/Spo0J family partition protein [Anaerofustis sp.]
MKKDVLNNIKLTNLDNLFTTQQERDSEKLEKITPIPIEELVPFANHPFYVLDDEKMAQTVESIRQFGVLTPIVVREKEEGGYEILSGHRRKRACEIAGITEIPAIIKQLTDEEAVIFMVDSNLQRETILPSEKAYAYKMRLEAMKRQGFRSDLTSGQLVQKSKYSVEILADMVGENYKQIQRYIRLTDLIPELLKMVDEKQLAFNPAVELSYVSEEMQNEILDVMDAEQMSPSLSQAQRIKKCFLQGILTRDQIEEVLQEEKKSAQAFHLKGEKFLKYFPKDTTPAEVEDTIVKLLESWMKRKNQPER